MSIIYLIDVVINCAREYGIYVGLVLGAGLVLWKKRSALIKFAKNIIKGNDYESQNQQICSTIARALETVLWKFNADRAYLFEYKGYDKRIGPIPFTTADNTVEVINPAATITQQKQSLQGIPLSSVPFWIERLSKEGSISIFDIEDIRSEDPTTYEILHAQSIKSVYAVSLVSFRGISLGFVGVDYCEESTDINSESCNILKCEALKIAGLLVLKHGFNGNK